MKLITYSTADDTTLRLGRVDDTAITPLSIPPMDFYRQGTAALDQLVASGDDELALDEVRFRPVVPAPQKIFCIGLNYPPHAAESGFDAPAEPVVFSKFSNALAGHHEAVPVQADWYEVDYEAELAVVIGRATRNVTADSALDAVLGYCCANDFSERSWQFRSSQWLMGKSSDGFLPLGPWLVTADEVGDPQNLTIRGWLDGELRQDSHTSQMIFSVAQIIAYISRTMTLQPGDVISTGTPAGVIFGMSERHYMRAGAGYTVAIERLGQLENHLVEVTS